jgi:small ligand-binding sensory domain FIST
MAIEHATQRALAGLNGAQADLALVFFSQHHAHAAGALAHVAHRRLEPACLIGCSAEAVIGGEVEMENAPGVAVLALGLPGATITPFVTDDLAVPRDPANAATPANVDAAGVRSETHRATILLCDPFSVPVPQLLAVLSRARPRPTGEQRPAPIIGGLASAGSRPGSNALLFNDRVLKSGGVGVSLAGDVRVDTLVSQGCRPLGPAMLVTGVKGQMITSLGGRPAFAVLREIIEAMPDTQRESLGKGLFLGRAVSEYAARFGRDDFVMRNVLGVDKDHEAIAVADLLRVGTTVQFHVRDPKAAADDLALLLDAQRLHDRPAAGLMFACAGRGTRLFAQPHHDARAVSRAFIADPAAEERAKGGKPLTAGDPALMPLAGFFAAGEIGPAGRGGLATAVHAQSTALALFRAP